MNTPLLHPKRPVLIVEDEEPILTGYRMALSRAGITNLICHTDSREALKVIQSQPLDLILLDLNMPYFTGEELLEKTAVLQPGVPVLIVTGKDKIESAVYCMKKGALEYMVKPVTSERIVASVRNGLNVSLLQQENRLLNDRFLSDELKHPEWFSRIVTRDPAMLAIFSYIEAIAASDSPILITGETGVGKELIARAIHEASGRKDEFVAVNVAGLDDTMFSDTLFGHEKGAFTGANSVRQGLIAKAAAGTVFLDEIGDLSVASQVKLLRLLQESEYLPLGQDTPVKTSARFVVATNADLSALQTTGKFRADLFYRLSTHKIHIPPLRARKGDLPILVDHCVETAATRQNKKKPTVPRELYSLLAAYSFPGNIRELEAMLTDAVSRHTSKILSMRSLREYIETRTGRKIEPEASPASADEKADIFGSKLPEFSQVKRMLVAEAMRRANGNRTQAASLLGTTRQALSWYLTTPDSSEPGS